MDCYFFDSDSQLLGIMRLVSALSTCFAMELRLPILSSISSSLAISYVPHLIVVAITRGRLCARRLLCLAVIAKPRRQRLNWRLHIG